MMTRLALTTVALAVSTHALKPLSRREIAKTLGGAALAAPFAAGAAPITACPSGANNCWSTASSDKTAIKAWKFPAGTKKADAVAQLKEALDSYPQAGQEKVDLGGWSYAVDELAGGGYARLEYKSGLGNFAKFFNGGKPFVDDLEVLVGADSVAVRSSSRVGDSDFGVNAKRLSFLAAKLRAKGWDASPPAS